jgi:ribonuclease P protein component
MIVIFSGGGTSSRESGVTASPASLELRPPIAQIMSTKELSLPKTKRLTVSSEFARVKGQGTTERGRYLVLGAARVSEEKTFRVGFVTPKHIGTAVVRNRARRRLRDIVRTNQMQLRAGVWLVVVARPYAVNATYQQLRDEWLRLAERASILAP